MAIVLSRKPFDLSIVIKMSLLRKSKAADMSKVARIIFFFLSYSLLIMAKIDVVVISVL
jgi:hypothetical protein